MTTSTPLLIVDGVEIRRTPHGYTIAGHPVTQAGAGAIARWLLAKPCEKHLLATHEPGVGLVCDRCREVLK